MGKISIQPLATRMRPSTLSEVMGQDHLIGTGKILTRIVESGTMSSIILYGPPGVGKTSIAEAVAKDLNQRFDYFNASVHSKEDLKKIVDRATVMFPSIVFIDEIHRLTKQNQDYLLMKLEEGFIKLVGATTENPYMSVNPAIRSRSRILELKKVNEKGIQRVLESSLSSKKGYASKNVELEEGVLGQISAFSNGDVRTALGTLELAVESTAAAENGVVYINRETIAECMQRPQIDGDKSGDSHYNLLSAFQKSIRGSDVDASLHYLARLIKIGDLVSINRRLTVIAYEDIGLANPEVVAETLNAVSATERVGFPEARIILGYIVTRLALSKKSNVAYKAIDNALMALETGRDSGIPLSLHDTHYKGASALNKGEDYKYPHNYPHSLIGQQYLPEEFKDDKYLVFRDETDTANVQFLYGNLKRVLKNE